jgi:pSer/pThr/pTyr-binding forkhead associated (FHA) protein
MLLVVKKRDGTESRVRIREIPHGQTVTIGRGKDATIPIDDPKSSRINTAILYWDDLFVIRDTDSSNGTFVNGNKIEVCKLTPGDVIKIGDTEIVTSSEATSSDATVRLSGPKSEK